MKLAEIEVGALVVYCRDKDGPRVKPRYGKPDYREAKVIQPRWKAVSSWSESPEHKAVTNRSKNGVLVEMMGLNYGERDRVVKIVVNPRFLYADSAAELDAYWAEKNQQQADAKEERRQQNAAEVARQQALVDRIQALGIYVASNVLPQQHPDGTMHDFEPSLAVVERLLQKAEQAGDHTGVEPCKVPGCGGWA